MYSNARFGISFGIIGALEEAIRVTRDYAMERYVLFLPPSRLRARLIRHAALIVSNSVNH